MGGAGDVYRPDRLIEHRSVEASLSHLPSKLSQDSFVKQVGLTKLCILIDVV